MRRWGGSPEDTFKSQEVANTLWAYATMGREPGAGLMRVLEGREEALADTFKAQEVANTLWAYATMGREPEAGLMRVLEGRAEALADTFNTQGVANTLWEYATMGREPGAGLMRVLEGRAEALADTFNTQRFELLASCVYAARPLRSWLPATAHITAQYRLDTFCAQCQCLHSQLCIRGGACWPIN